MSQDKISFELSKRLREVCDTVVPCNKVADIGCDHGYVAITLINQGKARSALCMDINEGPLQAARQHISLMGLDDKIETRLSNGLHNTNVSDNVDTVIVAGMGGNLMSGILKEGREIVKGLNQMVLQPQSELFLVRRCVRELGFHIESEKFLLDMGKYYWIMDVRAGEKTCSNPELQELFDNYSEYLIGARDSLYREYIKKSIEINEGYLKNIREGNGEALSQKIGDLKKVLTLME